jgi:hypothetical protein
MARILFDGLEFDIGPEVTAGSVLSAACMKYADAGDVYRFKLFDASGIEVHPSEVVGKRRLSLCDVQKLRANFRRPMHAEYRAAAGK